MPKHTQHIFSTPSHWSQTGTAPPARSLPHAHMPDTCRTFIQAHHKLIKIRCRTSENLGGRSSVHTHILRSYWTSALTQISGHQQDVSQCQHYALGKFNEAFRILHCNFCHIHWLWSNLCATEPQDLEIGAWPAKSWSFRQNFTSRVQVPQRSPCAVNQLPSRSCHPEMAAQLYLVIL